MEGDTQAFDHCAKVLDIAAEAGKGRRKGIDIKIRLIPFLPNCPSILLVDNREMQFTIPTRIDQSNERYARQGLHGVLVMEDRQGGSQICEHFAKVFSQLQPRSLTVVKVDNGAGASAGSAG